MVVIKINSKDEFDQHLAKGKLVIVDFFAESDESSQSVEPEIEKLSNEYEDVLFLKVDVDSVQTVSAVYNITTLPTFKFFKNAELIEVEVVGTHVNAVSALIKKYKRFMIIINNFICILSYQFLYSYNDGPSK
ncbi:thioredoxin-like protein [Glomus cerebriforme]|uniref:Thioredoxin-like protein n=1 Tax=Glomus cerebriforme TaxID=658196 RepID=A0A397S4U0_9GLOM|nr:thioredoxin-like protein [Glomus cerebriforme]